MIKACKLLEALKAIDELVGLDNLTPEEPVPEDMSIAGWLNSQLDRAARMMDEYHAVALETLNELKIVEDGDGEQTNN